MRVSILGSRGYPSTYSGFETLVRELAPYARDAGHDVVVYCRWREQGRRIWETDGITCVASRGIDTTSLSTLTHGLDSVRDVRRRNIDAALVVNCANGYWLPLLNRAGIPSLVNVDGLEWERGKWGRIARSAFRLGATLAAREATALVADSQAIARYWRDRFDIAPRFIPYGAHPVASDAADRLPAVGVSPGEYTLSVGRLVPENNLEMTAHALDRLNHRRRLTHVIVGDGPRRTALARSLRRRAEADPLTLWVGHVEDQALLTQLWRHCALYIHGHSVGGTNPSLLQALAASAPTLAFDTPFNREVLGEAGRYYRDPAGLAGQVDELLAAPETARRLGEEGRARVVERYRWSDVCRQYIMALEEIWQAGRRPSPAA